MKYGNILFVILASISSTVIIVYAAMTYFSYRTGSPLSDGVFSASGLGNAGEVDMSASYIDGQKLAGYFILQSVGTGVFDSTAQIVPPLSGNPTRTCWTVEGTATSQNAGTIRLTGVDTSLRFNPVSRKLEGYGYNNGVGRVPFGDSTTCSDSIISDIEVISIQNGTDTVNSIAASSASFEGKVKIIGNLGGKTIFDTFYTQGVRFNASLFNTTLQRIRKNVGLLKRNLGVNQKNGASLVGDKMFLIDQPIKSISSISSADINNIRSLIIVGGDLYINQDFTGSIMNNPKGIILLKNENGVGGNLYIKDTVKHIRATIFAEGTVYSGESPSYIYNDTPEKITNLGVRQLYIFGALISRNTIGGASRSAMEVSCPYDIACSFTDATKYDLNYFRGFRGSGSLDPNRAYKDMSLDDFSMVIETDTALIRNPPPGFE